MIAIGGCDIAADPPDTSALTHCKHLGLAKLAGQQKDLQTNLVGGHTDIISSPTGPSAAADLRLDEFLSFSSDQREAIEQTLVPQILCREVRKRRRHPSGQSSFSSLVGMIVANALKGAEITSGAIFYSRRRSAYSGNGKGLYYPSFVGSKALCKAVDLMTAGGWLSSKIGVRKRRHGNGWYSTFRATEKLIHQCFELNISHHDICRGADSPLLVLKDKSGKRIWYDCRKHEKKIEHLKSYNKYIGRQKLSLCLSATEWSDLAAHLKGKGNRDVVDFSRTALHRVFNNSDWHQDGRFYGGWWQSIPNAYRDRIRINGETVVELDYSGFVPRAIYHAEGLACQSDPYDIPEIREVAQRGGKNWNEVRNRIKEVFNSLINAEPHQHLDIMANAIATHHRPIAHKFRTGEGLRIMYRESLICDAILTAAVREDVPILPIHDSYLVRAKDRDWLGYWMMTTYQKEFGFEPVIKVKG